MFVKGIYSIVLKIKLFLIHPRTDIVSFSSRICLINFFCYSYR